MANTAPYTVDVTGTDDETFVFVIPFENTDGTAFPFAEYTIEYAVTQCGCAKLELSEGDGILIVAPYVRFKAAMGSLTPGEYQHGCRMTEIATGDVYQIFDGTVTIGEGHFS
jgi:hypothetical protein